MLHIKHLDTKKSLQLLLFIHF